MKKYYNHVGYYLLCFFILAFPLCAKHPVIITLNLSAFLLLGILKNKISDVFKNIYTQALSRFVGILFLFLLATLLYSTHIHEGLQALQVKVSLLVFAFAFVQYDFTQQQIEQGFLLFTQTIVLYAVFLLCMATAHYWQSHNASCFVVENLTSVLEIQPSIFATYCFFSIILLANFIVKKPNQIKLSSLVFVIQILLLSVCIILLAPKLIIVLLLLFMGYKSLFSLKKLQKKQKLFLLLFIGVLLTIMISFSAQSSFLKNRFRGMQSLHFNYSDTRAELHHEEPNDSTRWTGFSYRLALMQIAWHLIQEKWVWGFGIGDAQPALMEEYQRKKLALASMKKSLPHNTYLNIWLAAGIFALLLFLYIFIYLPIQKAIRQKKIVYAELTIALFMILLFDNYCERLQAVLVLTLTVTLMLYETKHQVTPQINES